MPILIVTEWGDITEKYLEENYEKLANNLCIWKKQNPNWINALFWLSN